MVLIEQLVTLDKNDLKDITFEGSSIMYLQELIQELGLGNENIWYKTEIYEGYSIETKGLTLEEEKELENRDVNAFLYEEILTLDFEYNSGIIVHINKEV